MITAGTLYGRLTVLSPAFAKHDHQYYQCRCECGEEILARGTRLVSGEKTACPACAAAQRIVGMYIDGFQIKGFLRSKGSDPRFIVECTSCRERVTIPKELLKHIPRCECQVKRAAVISEGNIDPDFLAIL